MIAIGYFPATDAITIDNADDFFRIGQPITIGVGQQRICPIKNFFTVCEEVAICVDQAERCLIGDFTIVRNAIAIGVNTVISATKLILEITVETIVVCIIELWEARHGVLGRPGKGVAGPFEAQRDKFSNRRRQDVVYRFG